MINLSNRNLTKYDIPINTKELNLSYNLFSQVVSVNENLKALDMSHNKIAIIDLVYCQNDLEELNLGHNRLISIEGVSVYQKLRVLDLGYNFLSPNQLGHLGGLKSLKCLNLSHNHYSNQEALSYINTLVQVRELDLSFNDFLLWDVDLPMTNLKKLTLDNNKIKRLNLKSFPALEVLSCNENSIQEIFGLAELSQLRQFYADTNEIAELPPLQNIQILSASHNRLSSLPSFPILKMLNVSFNLLNSIKKVSDSLTQLIAASNCLIHLPFGMRCLEVLEVSNNKLSSLDFLAACEKLTILKVPFNEFQTAESVIEQVLHCPLTDFDISGLSITCEKYKKVLSLFPDLEKFNEKLVPSEDRALFRSQDLSLVSVEETNSMSKQSFHIRVNESPFAVQLRIDPSQSLDFPPDQNIPLSGYQSPRSVCLTPSQTETVSVLPSSPRALRSPQESSLLSHKMHEMYHSIVRSVKRSISKQISEFASENKIPKVPHHCRHTCRTCHKSIEHRKSAAKNKLEVYEKAVVKYAKIPPRPVLKNEKSKSIVMELVQGSQEFIIVSSLVGQLGGRTVKVVKVYKMDAFGERMFDSVFWYFERGVERYLDSMEGFSKQKLRFKEELMEGYENSLLCISKKSFMCEVSEGVWEGGDGLVVPAYVVWYAIDS